MMKPLPSFFLEFTQHTCGFFFPSSEQLHLSPSSHKILSSSVSPLTLRYLCSLFSSCPLLKLLHITSVHAHTYCESSSMPSELQSPESGQLELFLLADVYSPLFSNIHFLPGSPRFLQILAYMSLPLWGFLWPITHCIALPAVWGQVFFVWFSPCCISCAHSNIRWTVGTW